MQLFSPAYFFQWFRKGALASRPTASSQSADGAAAVAKQKTKCRIAKVVKHLLIELFVGTECFISYVWWLLVHICDHL